jgi:hypothetical protein
MINKDMTTQTEPSPTVVDDQGTALAAKLQALLKIGVRLEVIEAMLYVAHVAPARIDDGMGPMIYHGLPLSPGERLAWLEQGITVERLVQVCREHETGEDSALATDIEVLAYLASASLAAPLPMDELAVFMWVSQEGLTRYGKLPAGETFHQIMGQPQPFTLSDDQSRYVLAQLKSQIRRAVLKHAAVDRKGTGRRHDQP